MASGKIPIEKFDDTNYGFWKMQIDDYLYSKDLYQPIVTKLKDMKKEMWKLLDRKTMSVVRLLLSRNISLYLGKAKTKNEMLEILSDMYEKSSAANKAHLMRNIFNKAQLITKQLSTIEIDFDNEVQTLYFVILLAES